MQLRDYQQDAVNAVRAAFAAGKKAPLLVLPTGGGKTIIFCYIAAQAAARNNKVIILVHREELLRQTVEKLHSQGLTPGVIHPQFTPNIMAKVQVASVQTLIKRMHKFPFDPSLIIIDEAHHATAGSWRKISEYYANARKLGVTATPCRTDGAGLGIEAGGMFDELILGPDVQTLIDAGHLVQPVMYAPPRNIDLSGIRTVMGDYDKKEVVNRIDKPKITGHAVEHYTKLCPGDPAIVFCASVDHAKHVAEEFRRAGYSAFSVDGAMDSDERKRILSGLGNGQVQVVTSCDLVSEGTDIPAVACAILLRPTQSMGLYLQQVGRALRPVPGKTKAIILDHVGNSGGMKDGRWVPNHGLPEQPREWSLAGTVKRGKRKQENNPAIRVAFCKECLTTFKEGDPCPDCGKYPAVAPQQAPKVVAGELEQVTPEQAWQIRKEKHWEVRKAGTDEAALRRIAKERGYNYGWVKHMMRLAEEKAQASRAKMVAAEDKFGGQMTISEAVLWG